MACALVSSSLSLTRDGYKHAHAYYPGLVAEQEMIHRYVDPSLVVHLDNYGAMDLWDHYRRKYRYEGWSSLQLPSIQGEYVFATRKFGTDDFVTDFPESAGKPFLRHIPSDWIKIAETQLGYWDYFVPGRIPVLFYVPPSEPRKSDPDASGGIRMPLDPMSGTPHKG